jgi:hypothetical protein
LSLIGDIEPQINKDRDGFFQLVDGALFFF